MPIKITITGNVHGVFFRAFVENAAKTLGIKGHVKNTAEGVEVYAEGEEQALNKLVEECRKGPPGSKVNTVKVAKTEDTGSESFNIEY